MKATCWPVMSMICSALCLMGCPDGNSDATTLPEIGTGESGDEPEASADATEGGVEPSNGNSAAPGVEPDAAEPTGDTAEPKQVAPEPKQVAPDFRLAGLYPHTKVKHTHERKRSAALGWFS